MVRSLMALEPMGYIRPRRPPVPNGITVQKTSSSSFHLPAAMCSATCGAYSAYRGSVSHLRIFSAADADSLLAAAADLKSASARAASMDCVMQLMSGKAYRAQRPEISRAALSAAHDGQGYAFDGISSLGVGWTRSKAVRFSIVTRAIASRAV